MDKSESQQFFDQLAEFSRRILTAHHLPGAGSPWGTSRQGAYPKGAILHYTADSDMLRVLRWFCDPIQQAQASAHVVIGDRKYDWAMGFDEGLPLVEALPSTVVQCRAPEQIAWHATWTNAVTYGIECINAGEVRKSGDHWYWWPPKDNFSLPWTSVWKSDKEPVAMFGRFWEPYTQEQIESVVHVLRAVDVRFGHSLHKAWVTGHENVQGVSTPGGRSHDKRDPGPILPTVEIRRVLFDDATKIDPNAGEPTFAQDLRTEAARLALMTIGEEPDEDALPTLLARTQGILATSQPRCIAKAALYMLGYHIDNIVVPICTQDETASVWLFQKLMGITPDGQLGPQTYGALASRIADRLVKVGQEKP